MIKSLFDYEDDEKPQPKETESETAETEESIKQQLEDLNLGAPETPAANDETETITQIRPAETGVNFDTASAAAANDFANDEIETVTLPKIEQVYANAGEPTPLDNAFSEYQSFEDETETRARETELIPPETELPPQVSPPTPYRNVLQNENAPTVEGAAQTQSIFQTENVSQTGGAFQNENASRSEPQSLTTAETIRQSGMAWSAAVGLFGSILFMMILGWFFDLLTDASPFGIVAGIIIGAGIGFYQFFRMTSQIFKK